MFTYSMNATAFLNARHRGTAASAGEIHGHTWMLDVVADLPDAALESRDAGFAVPFADLEGALQSVLADLQHQVLDETNAFDGETPTTENLARLLARRLHAGLLDLGLQLRSVTVAETPTKSITVTTVGALPPPGAIPSIPSIPAIPSIPSMPPTAAPPPTHSDGAPGEPGQPQPPLVRPHALAVPLPSSESRPARRWPWFLSLLAVVAAATAVYLPLLGATSKVGSPQALGLWRAAAAALPLLHGAAQPWNTSLATLIVAAGAWLLGNPLRGVLLCLAVAGLAGSLGWLRWRNRLGDGGALVAALAWLVAPALTHTAFVAGDLRAAGAAAIVPWLLATVLDACERDRPASRMAAAALLAATVLIQPRIAVAEGAALAVLLLALAATRATTASRALQAGFALLLGLALAGWRLLPALERHHGGLTPATPWWQLFDPMTRLQAAAYFGPAAVVIGLGALLVSRARQPWALACVLAFCCLVLAATPAIPPSLRVPASWLAGIGTALLLAGGLAAARSGNGPWHSVWVAAILVALAADGWTSLGQMRGGPQPALLAAAALAPGDHAAGGPAAVLAPSGAPLRYTLAAAGRPVLASARTASADAALVAGWPGFATDRLRLVGATRVFTPATPGVRSAFAAAGFLPAGTGAGVDVWRAAPRTRGPYALAGGTEGLAVGNTASTWTRIFPSLARGPTPYIDRYRLATLKAFPLLVLAGVRWHSRSHAEALLAAYAAAGGRLVIDEAGAPQGWLSRRPRLFGVAGEPLSLFGSLRIAAGGAVDRVTLPGTAGWRAIVPQGLTAASWSLQALQTTVPLAGYRRLPGGGRVWFVGGNLATLAQSTHQGQLLSLLAGLTGLRPNTVPQRTRLALRASPDGTFQVTVPPGRHRLYLPAATARRLQLDGRVVQPLSLDGVPTLVLPGGVQTLSWSRQGAPGTTTGIAVSLLGGALLGWWSTRRPSGSDTQAMGT